MAVKRKSRRDRKKESQWLDTLSKWKESDQKASEYCRAHKLNVNNFHWWKRVLVERGKWKQAEPKKKSNLDPHDAQVKFTPVHLVRKESSAVSKDTEKIELKVGANYRIGLPNDFEPATLNRLLDVLAMQPC
jgi:hypothetical protein